MRKFILYTFILTQTCAVSFAKEPKVETIEWGEWSQESVDKAQAKGIPVLVEFTAKWCISCEFNEKNCLQNEKVVTFLKSQNIILLKADLTNNNEKALAVLKEVNNGMIPAFLMYHQTKKPDLVLTDLITPDLFIKTITEALKKNQQMEPKK